VQETSSPTPQVSGSPRRSCTAIGFRRPIVTPPQCHRSAPRYTSTIRRRRVPALQRPPKNPPAKLSPAALFPNTSTGTRNDRPHTSALYEIPRELYGDMRREQSARLRSSI
jgi:hypothetical protein